MQTLDTLYGTTSSFYNDFSFSHTVILEETVEASKRVLYHCFIEKHGKLGCRVILQSSSETVELLRHELCL